MDNSCSQWVVTITVMCQREEPSDMPLGVI